MATSLRTMAAITIFIGLLLAGLTSRQTTTDAAALMSAAQSPSPTPTPAPCAASQSWITSTTPPQEIGSRTRRPSARKRIASSINFHGNGSCHWRNRHPPVPATAFLKL